MWALLQSFLGVFQKPRIRQRLIRECTGYRSFEAEVLECRTLLAADVFITPTGGDWATASNWSLNRSPTTGDDVQISGLLPGCTVDLAPWRAPSGAITINSLTLDSTLNLLAGSLTVTGVVQGSGTVILSGGQLTDTTIAKGITIDAGGGTLDNVTLDGNLLIGGINVNTVYVENGLTLGGQIILGVNNTAGNLIFEGPQVLTGTGSVIFTNGPSYSGSVIEEDGAQSTDILTIGQDIVIKGPSVNMYGNFISDGTIEVDGGNFGNFADSQGPSNFIFSLTGNGQLLLLDGASAWFKTLTDSGSITLDQQSTVLASTYSQTTTGDLDLLIGSRSATGEDFPISVIGKASLAGSLTATYMNGFNPPPGRSYPVLMTYPTPARTGTFSTVTGGQATYTTAAVFLKTPVPKLVLNATTETDPSHVTVSYTISQADVTQSLGFNIYESDKPTVTPSSLDASTVLLGQATLDPATQAALLAEGTQSTAVSLTAPVAIDGAMPYIVVVANPGGTVKEDPASINTVSADVFYTPAEIRHAYGFDVIPFLQKNGLADAATYNANAGKGQTIAIVIEGGDPTLFEDVKAFDTAFGLTPFGTSGGPNLTIYTVNNHAAVEAVLNGAAVYQSGSPVALPAASPETIEESLDVEWAHAIAPAANVDVVEVDLPPPLGIDFNLLEGAKLAGGLPGVCAVSMSWGTIGIKGDEEDPGEATLDSDFTSPGVTYVNASGDDGVDNFGYPTASPNVLTVGGTSLQNLDANGDYPGTGPNGEVAWSGSGGGVSQYEPEPLFQKDYGVQSNGMRSTPDVAFDADSQTGVYAFDSSNGVTNGGDSWTVVGGTSLGAPCWAGLIAIVDQGRVAAGGASLTGYSQTLPALYSIAAKKPTDFNDIIKGSNGLSATPGYDVVTGLGTPAANDLVPDLIGYNGLSVVTQSVLSTPLLQGVATGSVQLATFTQGAATQTAAAYSVTVAWGDGGTDTTAEANSPLRVIVNGQSIEVFGTHAFSNSGVVTVEITMTGPGGTLATGNCTADVASNIASSVSTSRSGATYNRATKLFYASLAVTNNSESDVSGSFDILLQGLTSGVTLTYASVTVGSSTYVLAIGQDSSGDPYIHIPEAVMGTLARGKSLSISLRFSDPALVLFGYNAEVFSDPFDA